MTLLFNASRTLGTSSSREALTDILAAEVAHVVQGEVHVFLRSDDGIAWSASSGAVPNAEIAAIAARAWTEIGPVRMAAGKEAAIDRFALQPLGTIQRPTGLLLYASGNRRASLAEEQTISILCELGTIALERADLMQEMTRTQVLAESDKLRTALLSSISHDFRTPLSGILAAVTALIDQGGRFSQETAAELLADIRDQAERANRYVANLLDMIKLEAGAIKVKLEPTDVTDIISAAVRRCRRRGDPTAWIRAMPQETCLVEADPVLLEQVLHNVLDNALQYSGTPADGEAGVEISLHTSLHIAEIVVSDSGPGIPAADLERVFDKFYRVSGPQGGAQGTGLGLSISRGLIEAMGGTVQARSPVRDDRGTAIHICLKRLHES
jgi:two-component system sensor histidine kinase KdpD